jgi:hypothetical protein
MNKKQKAWRPIDYALFSNTGKDSVWWLNFIGERIAACAKLLRGSKGLETCDPRVWLSDLVKELWKRSHKQCPKAADENIFCARWLGLILALWSCRIIRAKSYDPRRDPEDRRRMMVRFREYGELLLGCITDESVDHVYFHAQEWDCPFPPAARYEPDETEKKRKAYSGKKGKCYGGKRGKK